VKLSAPPPPPPEPNEPGQLSPEQPAGVDAAGEAVPPAEPQTPPAPKVALWPAWFAGADFLLAVLVLALGFLVASFVARNSDIWIHLASGKRLLEGSYTPGTDPFSFPGADRPWVNHSLLFDIGAYLLYCGSGAALVVIKALATVLAFGLLIGIRRPGFPLWPWAAVAGVAVVASAPYLVLRPQVGSILLLSITMFLLFRMRHTPGSWRFPAAIGVTFWIWANTDEWFFIGPLALALVLIGELIQAQLAKPAEGETDESLGKLPDVPTLAKALGIGVLACMLNPHHIHVWELPFELVGSKEAALDPRFKVPLMSPLQGDYIADNVLGRSLGRNVNGLAFALLFVGGGAALGLAGARLRISHLALWIGFAALSLATILAIPFLAVVAIPLVAGRLNAISARLTLKTWGDPKTRLLLFASAGGRVLLLIGTVVACVLAWPGWMQPSRGNEAYTWRVGWAVEPDEGMKVGAAKLQEWRASGQLPPEARGFIASIELANHCAWFAPDEKVYINGRLGFHRPELHDFITIRTGLNLVQAQQDDRPDPREVMGTLNKMGAEYFVIHSGPGDGGFARRLAREVSERVWADTDHCSPWFLDGQSTISGFRFAPGRERPTFAALRLDPVVLAFGPAVERIPPGTVTQIRPVAGWEESFLRSPRVAPLGADEALGWLMYGNINANKEFTRRQDALEFAVQLVDRVCGGGGCVAHEGTVLLYIMSRRFPPPTSDSLQAIPCLALRAARRAIAADGDHPDGYYALSKALENKALPMSDVDRTIGQITALRQCLSRLPPPEEYHPGVYSASPTLVAMTLANLYLGRRPEFGPTAMPGVPINALAFYLLSEPSGGYLRAARILAETPGGGVDWKWIGYFDPRAIRGQPTSVLPLDLVRENLQLALKYLPIETQGNEEARSIQKNLETDLQFVERSLATKNAAYEQRKARAGGKLSSQVEAALEYNLVGEALQLLKDADAKDLTPPIILSRIGLELVVGRLEDASADLEALGANPNNERWMAEDSFRPVLGMLNYQKCFFEGNYAEGGSILEGLQGRLVGLDPFKEDRKKIDPKPFIALGDHIGEWAVFSPLASASSLDVLLRLCIPVAAVDQYGVHRGFGFYLMDLRAGRERDAEFFLRRGLLSLFEADIPGAKARFLQTRQPANKDWGLPEFRHPAAEQYLHLIEEAEKKAAKK
jgi:hypothetical protein